MPFYVFNCSNYQQNINEYLNLSKSQPYILTLWHIESFEGGSDSRIKFLEKQAIKFNKKHPNYYICAKTLSIEQLKINLENNILPDLISFGIGSGCLISANLEELENNLNIRNDLLEYGKLNSKILAYPYMMSGYCLITNQNYIDEDDFVLNNLNKILVTKKISKNTISGFSFSQNSYLNFCEVLAQNNINNLNQVNFLANQKTTYETYIDFINQKCLSIIGTTRDAIRCKNRESNGMLSNCGYTFLGGYSDLVQYIGVVKNDQQKMPIAKLFSKFLTEEENQKDLTKIGLFSTGEKSIYKNDFMKDFEDVLKNNLKSENVFSNYETISNNQNKSFKKVFAS